MAATKVASLVVAAVGIWFGPSYRDVAGGALSSWGGGSDAPASRSSRSALFDEEPSDEDEWARGRGLHSRHLPSVAGRTDAGRATPSRRDGLQR